MRYRMLLVAVLLVASLAGCLGSDTDGDLDQASEDTGEDETDAPGQAVEPVVRYEQTYEGIAPDPEREPPMGPFNHTFDLPVPENATEVRVWHNATYTGLWPAVAHVVDASGESRTHSVESCDAVDGLVPPGQPGVQEEWSCALSEQGSGTLEAGDWELQLTWQAGEVYEEYTLDVVVWGYPAE